MVPKPRYQWAIASSYPFWEVQCCGIGATGRTLRRCRLEAMRTWNSDRRWAPKP